MPNDERYRYTEPITAPITEHLRDDHIFALLLINRRRIFFESDQRVFFINGKQTGDPLTKERGVIYTELLRHPNEDRSYDRLYKVSHPEDVTTPTRFELGDLLRPPIFHIREALKRVDRRLLPTIQVKRNKGMVYVPDASVASVLPGSLSIVLLDGVK